MKLFVLLCLQKNGSMLTYTFLWNQFLPKVDKQKTNPILQVPFVEKKWEWGKKKDFQTREIFIRFLTIELFQQMIDTSSKDKETASFHFYSMKKLINEDSTGILSTVHEIPLVKVSKDQSNDPLFYLKNQGIQIIHYLFPNNHVEVIKNIIFHSWCLFVCLDEITKAKKTDTLSVKTNLVSNRITQNRTDITNCFTFK